MLRIWFPDSVCGVKKQEYYVFGFFKNMNRFACLIKHDDTSPKIIFIIFYKKMSSVVSYREVREARCCNHSCSHKDRNC